MASSEFFEGGDCMTWQDLKCLGQQFVEESPFNRVSPEEALAPGLAGLRLYDAPVWGCADAHTPLFEELKKPEAVGPQFLTPEQWLPGAKSVISFFLPFSKAVKDSNANGQHPSLLWYHGRIEGQRMVMKLCQYLKDLLEAEGARCVIPCADERFRSVTAPNPDLGCPWENAMFTSNWSERHVGYICGLGTFSLSKGLITERGVAGRLGSLVVDVSFPPCERTCIGLYDYCIHCGACAKRCPANAISLETGKDHLKCASFLAKTHMPAAPYYGCGKCQCGVPCESGIPGSVSMHRK